MHGATESIRDVATQWSKVAAGTATAGGPPAVTVHTQARARNTGARPRAAVISHWWSGSPHDPSS